MTGPNLMAVRLFLCMSITDAARFVGEVAERSWRTWESLPNKAPDDVIAKINALVDYRNQIYRESLDLIKAMPDGDPKVFPLYTTIEDWFQLPMSVPIKWRAHCSAMAALVIEYKIELVRFDNDYFKFWLENAEDTLDKRMEWAKMAYAQEQQSIVSKALKAG
ncbi:MAG: Aca2/YdiL-like domain-containing protein [Methylophilus sp.]|uniref:Aca2/YdiL-like domain-containing protein n=1 Tax=Methylophilus sp. TaxID=29541 RepID=UPI003F9F16E7